jgi:2-haloacid dehalogenase
MAERHSTELRRVGYDDDPLRCSGGGALHGRLGKKVGSDARLGVDAAGTHDARVEPELRKRMFGDTTRQRQFAGTDLPPWQEKIDARALVQLKNGSESEWHDGQSTATECSSHLHGGGPTVEDDRLPIRKETGGSFPYRRLGFAGLEGANAIRGLLGTEEDTRRSAVHASQASTALQRLEVAPHGHFGAIKCRSQLPDRYGTAFTEGLHDRLMPRLHIHSVQTTIKNVSSHNIAGLLPVEAVVFDVGGVLLDWNPRHLYRKLFGNEAEMERFLDEICSPAWHAPHDRGASTAASCAELASAHPQFSKLIWAWSRRSEEMIGGVDAGSVEVLRAVRETELPCYALTNMEAETYPLRLERFPFLRWFDGTVVSGREGVAKPEPEIFMRLLDRFGLTSGTTLMIDDTKENLDAASKLGMQTVLFRSSRELRAQLEATGILRPSLAQH